MKEIARYLELIKYFTLKKNIIRSSTKADIEKVEKIKDKYIQLSGNISFNIESIIIDFGSDYSSSRKEKELYFYLAKNPINDSTKYIIVEDSNGLMKPAIINNHIKDGNQFKRFIFPSNQDSTYSFDYKLFDDWYQTTLVDTDQNYSRPQSLNILVEESSVSAFKNFLNESYSQWKSRFTEAKTIAMGGNFYWFSLYDPRIYEYELSFEDRKAILNYMVYSLNWSIIFPGYGGTNGVDEYELFSSLIYNINSEDNKLFYNYMFEVDSLTQKTNLEVYENKLPVGLYDLILNKLMRSFYSAKTSSELFSDINKKRLFPIGLEITTRESKQYIDLDNPNTKPDVLTDMKLGVEYDIETNYKNSKINIVSAIEYKIVYGTNTIEFRKCEYIGKGNISFAFDDVVYITPYFMNKKFEGVNIPYGCIIPVPAFSLEWLNSKNNDTEKIVDQIGKLAVAAAVIFPIFSIFEESYVLYNIIGLGFTVIGNALGAGVQDQIKRYDEAKSTPGHPYTKGQDFLNFYYLISSIYVGTGIKNAISGADNKIKALFEVENLLGSYSVISDFRSFMTPNDNLDSFNLISQNMDHLQKEYNRFKNLKNQN
nr:hypothetical protein [Flavobacterium sp. ASV13]